MMNESVQLIMTKDLITLGPESSLAHVRDVFMEKRIHHVPIEDEGKLVGMITTHDLWRSQINYEDYDKIMVKEVMTKKLVKLEIDDKIGTAAELFLANHFHAIPVVNDGILVGLVTTFDILRYEFLREYPDPILYKDILEKGMDATH
ncbi:MAG: CBS domain-containing protein [Saprospiraceae bacterium]|nr:CBS domain-containing protein [Saprospiraceae bacterium]